MKELFNVEMSYVESLQFLMTVCIVLCMPITNTPIEYRAYQIM